MRAPKTRWWFQEEARALAALAHPAIVRARDFGALARRHAVPRDGRGARADRSTSGSTSHTSDGACRGPSSGRLIDQVLAALAHAHARGIIHGDLKPSNVMLDIPRDRRRSRRRVHVLDLGLAWLMQDRVDHRLDGAPEPEPTVRWGAGTPGWMAPEQIRYAAPHVGPATDLYALGCILFAMLTDREPYEGTERGAARAAQERARARARRSPEACRARSGRSCMRLMAKRPWHRFEFAADARRAVAQFTPRGASADRDAVPIPELRRARAQPCASAALIGDADVAAASSLATTTTGLLGLRPSPFVARDAERARLLERRAPSVAQHGAAAPLRRSSRAKRASARAASPSGSARRCTSAG